MLVPILCLHHFYFYLFRTRFYFNPKPNDGGLFICCGQLVGKKGGPRHMNCPGSNSGYRVGGLFLEMEHCPFACCAHSFVDPESNISHQEEVHSVPHNSNSLVSNYHLFRRPPSAPKITPLTQC